MSDLGNNEYKYACDELLFPMVREFKPDVILISCGFDGAIHDFLGWSQLTPIMYAYMTHELTKICSHTLAIQEGGYNCDYLGQHASGVVRALISGPEDTQFLSNLKPSPADLDANVKSFKDIDS